MDFKIKFHPEAKKEYDNLDNSVKIKVIKLFNKLKKEPELGKPLGNNNLTNLSGFYKLYVENKKYRIVYKILNNELQVFILGIGKRENNDIYKVVNNRIK